MTKKEKDAVAGLLDTLMHICCHDLSEQYHSYDDEPSSREEAAKAINKYNKEMS